MHANPKFTDQIIPENLTISFSVFSSNYLFIISGIFWSTNFPSNIYLFVVNNRNIKKCMRYVQS